IALCLFLVVANDFKFPDVPGSVLALLGISGSSYLVSKGIQFSDPAGVARPTLVLSPSTVSVAAGATQMFTASAQNVSGGATLPPLTWSLDAPAEGKIDPMGANQARYTAPPAGGPPAGTKVSVRVKGAGFEDGIAVITL